MNIRPAGKDILKAGNKTNCTTWSELAILHWHGRI